MKSTEPYLFISRCGGRTQLFSVYSTIWRVIYRVAISWLFWISVLGLGYKWPIILRDGKWRIYLLFSMENYGQGTLSAHPLPNSSQNYITWHLTGDSSPPAPMHFQWHFFVTADITSIAVARRMTIIIMSAVVRSLMPTNRSSNLARGGDECRDEFRFKEVVHFGLFLESIIPLFRSGSHSLRKKVADLRESTRKTFF